MNGLQSEVHDLGLLTILRTLMIEDLNNAAASTKLLFTGRCCERIDDHIWNVAESVHFIVRGEIHHGRPMQQKNGV